MPNRLQESTREVYLKVPIVIEPDGNGFHAYCPVLKGLHVSGSTQPEALENAKQAVVLYLEDMISEGEPIPMSLIDSTIYHGEFRSVNIPLWPILKASGISLRT